MGVFAGCAALTAGVGSVLCAGVAGAAAGAVYSGMTCPTGSDTARCVAIGAVSGGAAGLTGGAMMTAGMGMALAGAGSSFVGDGVDQLLTVGTIDPGRLAAAMTVGTVLGAGTRAGFRGGRPNRAVASSDGEAGASVSTGAIAMTERLQGHVDKAVADYDNKLIGMSFKQKRAVGRHPGLEDAYRGQVIDSAVKKAVSRDRNIDVWVSRSGEVGPDFHDIETNTWWDMTTPGQWQNHVDRYTSPFGNGIGLFTK